MRFTTEAQSTQSGHREVSTTLRILYVLCVSVVNAVFLFSQGSPDHRPLITAFLSSRVRLEWCGVLKA
jgi:hypothetical protein